MNPAPNRYNHVLINWNNNLPDHSQLFNTHNTLQQSIFNTGFNFDDFFKFPSRGFPFRNHPTGSRKVCMS